MDNIERKIRSKLNKHYQLSRIRPILINSLPVISFLLFVLFLINSELMAEAIFIENIRYFLSAAVQSYAALAAIIFVIYTIIDNKTKKYEELFDSIHEEIIESYLKNKVIKLLQEFMLVILTLLFSIVILFDNKYYTYSILGINVILISYTIPKLINFLKYMISNPSNNLYFSELLNLINNKFHHCEIFKVFENIKKNVDFRINSSFERHLIKILNGIVLKYGSLLNEYKNMGDEGLYHYFKEILEYSLQLKNKLILTRSTYLQILDDLYNHILMCAKDQHCKKYVDVNMNLFVIITNRLNYITQPVIFRAYLKKYFELGKIFIKQNQLKHLWEFYLYKIAESIAVKGLHDYQLILEGLDNLGYSNKNKLKYLIHMIEKFNETYRNIKNLKNNIMDDSFLKSLKIPGPKESEMNRIASKNDMDDDLSYENKLDYLKRVEKIAKEIKK